MRPALAALALLIAVPAAAQSSRDCDCRDLQELQRELDNAIKLQGVFQRSVAELRTHGPSASQIAFQQVALGAWRASGAQGSRRHEHNVATSLYGSDVNPDLFGEQTPERRAQLCQPTGNMQQDLQAAMRAAPCRGIAESLRRHEQHHVEACIASDRVEAGRRFTGYPAWIRQTGAEFAEREVEAYGAQIAVLRQEIGRALSRSNFALEGEGTQVMTMPQNPLYRSITLSVRTRVELRSAGDATDGSIRLEGEGPFTVNGTIQGRCRYTGNIPYTLTGRAELRSDGSNAEVVYSVSGTVPAFGVQCDIPGMGRGGASGGPTPTGPGLPGRFSLPLQDGGEWREPIAQSEVARALAGSGIGLSGETRMRLVCRPGG